MHARSGCVLLAAGDAGPREALRPLLQGMPAMLPEEPMQATQAYWLALMRSTRASGLACGTSDTPAGRALEAAARRAAAQAGIAAAAIEDFPGNYYDVPGGEVALVVVESAAVANFTRAKLGRACPALASVSPARYDAYRREAPSLRARVNAHWASGERSVLWAGQPETEDSLRTLARVLPHVRRHGATLLFKAHPRDLGYRAGAYRALLADGARDVTALAVPEALALAPLLVVTQFSSVAIEAGFYGIPSLSVLLSEAGGSRLLEKKNYAVPPYCEAGAAVFAREAEDIPGVFAVALEERTQRENIIRCFDAYFATHVATLPALVTALGCVFGEISP